MTTIDELDEFYETECKECASKPGTPDLCSSCLGNREKIARAVQAAKEMGEKTDNLRDQVERWKIASGLEDSSGDPDGITPEASSKYRVKLEIQIQNAKSRINALEAEVHRLDKAVTVQEIRERALQDALVRLACHIEPEEF